MTEETGQPDEHGDNPQTPSDVENPAVRPEDLGPSLVSSLIESENDVAQQPAKSLAEYPILRGFLLHSLITFPVFSFLGAALGKHWSGVPWQSGHWSVYAGLLVNWPTQAVFYPMILFSLASALCWLFQPQRFHSKAWVQLGIAGGILWSLALGIIGYSHQLLIGLIVGGSVYALLAAVLIGPAHVIKGWIWYGVTLLGMIAFFLIGSLQLTESPLDDAWEVLVIPGPIAAFTVFTLIGLSIWTRKGSFRFSVARLLGVTAYLGGAFATWRFAFERALIEYEKLPKEDPNCFVCSAAAFGHTRIVGTPVVETSSNGSKVNAQMQWLKAGEIALQYLCPRVHRKMRRVYNRIGPVLAAAIRRQKWLATMAFLMLLPGQWAVQLLVRIAGVKPSLVRQLYRRDSH